MTNALRHQLLNDVNASHIYFEADKDAAMNKQSKVATAIAATAIEEERRMAKENSVNNSGQNSVCMAWLVGCLVCSVFHVCPLSFACLVCCVQLLFSH